MNDRATFCDRIALDLNSRPISELAIRSDKEKVGGEAIEIDTFASIDGIARRIPHHAVRFDLPNGVADSDRAQSGQSWGQPKW